MASLVFVAFGCAHVPLTDQGAFQWLLSQIREVKPDVIVNLGDWFEADSVSRWPSEYDWSLEDEYRKGDSMMAEIRAAAPSARRIFLPGNHDDNILAQARVPIKLRSRVAWNVPQYDSKGKWLNKELLTYWERPASYIYCRRRGVWRLGQVTFSHGFESSLNADLHQSILLGVPNGLYVGAHTHKPLPVTQAVRTPSIPLPYWYANVGCLRDLKPVYVQRKRTHGWGHACIVGEAHPDGRHRHTRHWSAELRRPPNH